MQIDVRNTPMFRNLIERATAWYRPGDNAAVEIADLSTSPDARWAAATSVVCETLEGTPSTRIVFVDLESGALRIATRGPRSDRLPRWSPDGRQVAFLSDRDEAYKNKLRLLDPISAEDKAACAIDGWVEYHHWSSDGTTLLLGVAGFGADLAGAQGGFSVATAAAERAPWMPEIDTGVHEDALRSVWLYDVASDTARKISPAGVNVWEAVWCGAHRVAAVCSDAPGEAEWYIANLRLFDLRGGAVRVLLSPKDQLGWLSASPTGERLALVEAVCSDRTVVAGNLRIIDVATSSVHSADTLGSDVVQTIWRGETHVLFAAANGPASIIGVYDCESARATEIWRSIGLTPSGLRFPEIAPLGRAPADCLFACEGYFRPQELISVRNGIEKTLMRMDAAVDKELASLGSAESITWTAPDGLTIDGWLMKPNAKAPHPLILEIHGGPVWYFRPRYIGRSLYLQALLAQGYAVFQVNPRGSSGRGQEFARRVFGDMGGADTHDYLSGIDALVERGIADPERLGVTGGSYGGFMTSWLITQDERFAAAVPVAPVTDWVSEHLTCHIPYFCKIFLDDDIDNPTGKYFSRSPIHFVNRVKTPTLSVCGALDKNTPAVQALEFHHALQLQGVQSILLTYPLEGHGVRTMPASFDYIARLVTWFDAHMAVAV
jgi:dipeptidyl aminopeptidase/acylaminoacyl peptidase